MSRGKERRGEERRGGVVIRFRADVEGLRAVAVVLVILNHLDVRGFHGGFIGVDVFFVISGYLITSLLAAEYAEKAARNHGRGSISIPHFYLRRARRILPAALAVIVAVVVAANLLLNTLRVAQVKHDAIWTVFFASNINFIRQATDYFAAGFVGSSPFQHYWSLAVEEQFYFVWPVLFLLVTRAHGLTILGRPIRWRSRLCGTLLIIGAASFLWSIQDTGSNPARAYFSTFTRAWELAIGALLALVGATSQMTSFRALVASSSGIALLVAGCFVIDANSAFPGYIALLPTLGTALVIAGGIGGSLPLPNRVLGIAPMRFVGRISYSLYLWHWPLIVFAAALFPHASSQIAGRIAIGVLTFAVAVPSYQLIERPFRKMSINVDGERLKRSLAPRRARPARSANGTMVAAALLGAVVLGFAIAAATQSPFQAAKGAVSVAGSTPGEFTPPAVEKPAQGSKRGRAGSKRSGGKQGTGSATYSRVLLEWQSTIRQSLALRTLPGSLQPLQSHLRAVDAPCQNYRLDIVDHEAACTWGNPRGRYVAAITGDSHASMWLGTVEAALDPETWSLHPFTRSWCGWTDGQQNEGENKDCPAIQRQTLDELKRLRPDILILSQDGFDSPAGTEAALRRFMHVAKHVVVLGRSPYAADFTACLRGDANISGCQSVVESGQYQGVQTQRSVTEHVHATFIDTTPWFCFQSYRCPPVIAGAPVFIDGNHISAELAPKLAPLLRASLRTIVPS